MERGEPVERGRRYFPTEQDEMPLMQFALSYARNGWPVFPLHGKKPFEFIAPDVKSHGYKDATTDEQRI